MDGEGEPWGNPFRTVKLWDNLVCIRLCAGFFHLSLQIYCLPFSTPGERGLREVYLCGLPPPAPLTCRVEISWQ